MMKSRRTTPSSATVAIVSGLPDERQSGGADDDACGEVAQHGAEAEQPEQRNRHDGGAAECQDRRQETDVGGCIRHHFFARRELMPTFLG